MKNLADLEGMLPVRLWNPGLAGFFCFDCLNEILTSHLHCAYNLEKYLGRFDFMERKKYYSVAFWIKALMVVILVPLLAVLLVYQYKYAE